MQTLACALLATAAGFHGRPALLARRAGSVLASEEQQTAETPTNADTIFTLQERQDGWDDVRGALKEQIKQREKPWSEIKTNYLEPASRWSKAAGAVAAEALPELTKVTGKVVPTGGIEVPSLSMPSISAPSLSAPSLELPTLSTPSKEGAISALGGLLDRVGDAREAKAVAKKVPVKSKAFAAFNAVLLLGTPIVAIAAVAALLFTTTYFQ